MLEAGSKLARSWVEAGSKLQKDRPNILETCSKLDRSWIEAGSRVKSTKQHLLSAKSTLARNWQHTLTSRQFKNMLVNRSMLACCRPRPLDACFMLDRRWLGTASRSLAECRSEPPTRHRDAYFKLAGGRGSAAAPRSRRARTGDGEDVEDYADDDYDDDYYDDDDDEDDGDDDDDDHDDDHDDDGEASYDDCDGDDDYDDYNYYY